MAILIFVDSTAATLRMEKYEKSVPSLSSMVDDNNAQFFPRVKCPVGCNEFVEQCCKVNFVHYLSRLVPKFKQFNSDAQTFRGARSDYEETDYLFGGIIELKPNLLVNETGIFLLTCADHDKNR